MIPCVFLGDSIAVGIGTYSPECQTIARVGITSQRYADTMMVHQDAQMAVISLGVNDDPSANTVENLRRVRADVNAARVFWIVPNVRPYAREAVQAVAIERGDALVDLHGFRSMMARDQIHPTGQGYELIADTLHDQMGGGAMMVASAAPSPLPPAAPAGKGGWTPAPTGAEPEPVAGGWTPSESELAAAASGRHGTEPRDTIVQASRELPPPRAAHPSRLWATAEPPRVFFAPPPPRIQYVLGGPRGYWLPAGAMRQSAARDRGHPQFAPIYANEEVAQAPPPRGPRASPVPVRNAGMWRTQPVTYTIRPHGREAAGAPSAAAARRLPEPVYRTAHDWRPAHKSGARS